MKQGSGLAPRWNCPSTVLPTLRLDSRSNKSAKAQSLGRPRLLDVAEPGTPKLEIGYERPF
jgi:hypothetical protein